MGRGVSQGNCSEALARAVLKSANMSSAIDSCPNHRPRERLVTVGSGALSDAELLALILGTGRRGEDVLSLSHRLLGSCGGLAGLSKAGVEELTTLQGLGPARAAALLGALELGRRGAGVRPLHGQRLATPADVWTHYRARLANTPAEEFWVLGLDARHKLQIELCVARGTLTGVEVHPREVFRPLIRSGCASALLCHNHPSGDPSPSRQDIELTLRLRQVGELCGIAVLDHVVVAADGFVSLAERGFAL